MICRWTSLLHHGKRRAISSVETASPSFGWPSRSAACGRVGGSMCRARPHVRKDRWSPVIPSRRASSRGDVGAELLRGVGREQHFPSLDPREDQARAPVGPGRRHDGGGTVRGLDPQRVGAMRAENGHDLPVPRVDAKGNGHLRRPGSARYGSLVGDSAGASTSTSTITS